MHRDRNNNSWSELKAKRHHDEYDDAPTKAANAIHGDLVSSGQDGRREKNDRAAWQLERVEDMFKDMADRELKQNKPDKNKLR